MTMRISLILSAFLASVAMASAGDTNAPAQQASPDAPCTFRHPMVEVDSIERVPWFIQKVMLAHMDPRAREDAKFEWHDVMAPRGAPFNSTDMITQGYPMRRFIRAGHWNQEWFVWYEKGGFVYSKNLLLFHARARGVPILRAFLSWRNENPCALTDDLLDFRPAPTSPAGGSW